MKAGDACLLRYELTRRRAVVDRQLNEFPSAILLWVPLTFPSHLAAVLPLKLWAPRWFDGVALAAGSVAPDVAYLFLGTRAALPNTHSLSALIWWCLPLGLIYAWVVRRAVPAVGSYLPGSWSVRAGWHRVSHRWWITVGSVLVGAVTHIGWDWLTHTDGWITALFGVD